MSCCKVTPVCLSFAGKCWRCFTNTLVTLRHYAFSRQHRTKFSEDVYAFVLWRYVAVQIWRVKELFVPGIVASTIKCEFDRTTRSTGVHQGQKQKCCSLSHFLIQVQQDASGPGNSQTLGCLWTNIHRCTWMLNWTEKPNVSFPLRAN